jgi:outer membrane immunogenic protein
MRTRRNREPRFPHALAFHHRQGTGSSFVLVFFSPADKSSPRSNGHLGYGFGTGNWVDPNDPGGATGNFNLTGFLAGATLGVNFQTDGFVFGAEADFDGSLIDGKKSSPFCSTGTQCETKNFWFSTLRGRLGYAADRVLFYGTAGGALGNVSAGQSGNFQRFTKGGWTAGAGLEAAFTENLTARIEYLYLKLGNVVCTSPAACGADPGGNPDDPLNFHQHDSGGPRIQIPLTRLLRPPQTFRRAVVFLHYS